MNLKRPHSTHYKVEVTVISHDSRNVLFNYGCHGNSMGLCRHLSMEVSKISRRILKIGT